MEVFEKKEFRHLTAKSVSMRLGLPYDYVRDRFDQLHRIAKYDAVNRAERERKGFMFNAGNKRPK